MRTASVFLFAMTMGGGVAACGGLADDSEPGRRLGRIDGRVTGDIPDDAQLQLAIIWRGGPPDDEACRAIGGFEPIVQAVSWSTADPDRFRIELTGPPPAGAVSDSLGDGAIDGGPERDGGYSLGGGGDIPSRRAEGVLVAYDDRDGDGQLDLCSDATCTDRILGASNPAAPFLHREVVHQDPDGYLGWSLLDDAYPEVARSLLYVEEAWKPYGVREIPAGYAVWRMDADVAVGERFLDAFDPTIDIEVPVVDSPVLDQLACEGGCDVRFAYGSPDCPDLETTWCTLRPRLPPVGVRVGDALGHCAAVDGQCIAQWQRLTIEGCTRRLETWHSCPTPDEEVPLIDGSWNRDPAAWDWSCVESP